LSAPFGPTLCALVAGMLATGCGAAGKTGPSNEPDEKEHVVEIIAHRGASWLAPENTLASVRLGYELGAEAVEVDVWQTRGGRIVAIHDRDTSRVSGKHLEVGESSFAELRALEVGAWKHERFKGERIPSLEEVLALIPDGRRLFIEVKCGAGIAPELARVLAASGKAPEQTAVISFDLEAARAVKEATPALEVSFLAKWRHRDGRKPPSIEELISTARGAGLDGLDLQAPGPYDDAFMAKVREAGLKLYVWTVDDPLLAKDLHALGVDGITTNRPAWLRKQIEGAE
jgi:glycerophosphoryl diester phosphodiesterase